MTDFSKPQPYNVPIGGPDLSDEQTAAAFPVPPALYPISPTPGIEPEPDLYPEQTHGVRGPRLRRR